MDKKMEELEDEIKVLKNEVKGTLTDIREFLLTHVDNPFPLRMTAGTAPPRDASDGAGVAPAVSNYPDGGATLQQAIPPAGARGQVQRVVLGARDNPEPPVNVEAGPVTELAHNAPVHPAQWQSGPAAGPAQTPAAPHSEPRMESRSANESSSKALLRTLDREASESEESDDMDRQVVSPGAHNNGGVRQPETPDLVTVAMLASWVEDGIRLVGRERLVVIVDMYASMGRMSGQVKEVILQLLSLDDSDGAEAGKVPLSECVRLLADLDNLLERRGSRSAADLLAGFFKGKALYRAAI